MKLKEKQTNTRVINFDKKRILKGFFSRIKQLKD